MNSTNFPNPIFALDIGTRTVVGILGEMRDEYFHIIDVEWQEHSGRAMLDGQIHDIEQVAKLIIEIKHKLEERNNIKFKEVAVAVAGRALKTALAKYEQSFLMGEEITVDDVLRLELNAIQEALLKIRHNENTRDFHCVGYSVVNYYLDDSPIGNLIGQEATKIGIEVLATFLPRVVVDSMFSTLRRCDMIVSNLTLEPIAALEAIIPPTMRKLNLVLVDVGAGTSDIAITKNGTITAYGMVPLAGDEITEKLCDTYLLDFPIGERVKKELQTHSEVEMENVLGIVAKYDSREILEVLNNEILNITKEIGKEILKLNDGIPQAILCVGGASQMEYFHIALAETIGLSEKNVGVRLPSAIKMVENVPDILSGPDAITPIGIALSAIKKKGLHFINVIVNQEKIQLVNLGEELKVMHTALFAGIDTDKLSPKMGISLTIEINGQLKIISGTLGEPPKIMLNSAKASLNTIIREDDIIEIKETIKGKDAKSIILDLLTEEYLLNLTIDNKPFLAKPAIFMNGKRVSHRRSVLDRAKIEITNWIELDSLLLEAIGELAKPIASEMQITIDGKTKMLSQVSYNILVNGKVIIPNKTKVYDGDEIKQVPAKNMQYHLKDVIKLPQNTTDTNITVNGTSLLLKGKNTKIIMNGKEVDMEAMIPPNAIIKIIEGNKSMPIVSDIFNYMKLDQEQLKTGKSLKITVDGEDGGFVTPLNQGAKVEIYFE